MSAEDELARARAYRAQQIRRAAAERTRRALLSGSVSARRRLAERWAAWGPADLSQPPTTPQEPTP